MSNVYMDALLWLTPTNPYPVNRAGQTTITYAFGGPGTYADARVKVGNAFVKSQRSSSIIQRMATVEEVANLVVYVCSPQASATTGAALRVDGGVVDTIA